MSKEEFARRREQCWSEIVNSYSRGAALHVGVIGNEMPLTSAGGLQFVQHPGFFYLTGITLPNLILTRDSSSSTWTIFKLPLLKNDESGQADEELPVPWWAEKMSKERIHDFPTIHPLRSVQSLSSTKSLFVCMGNLRHPLFSGLLPHAETANHILNRLRQRKSDYERKCLWQATRWSLLAHQQMLQKTYTSADTDFTVQAEFARALINQGSEFSYSPITLIGQDAFDLHGVSRGTRFREGEWLLCDVAGTCEGYHSDLTRSYPIVSGNPDQLQLSEKWLKYYRCALELLQYAEQIVQPGMWFYKGKHSIQEKIQQYVLAHSRWNKSEQKALLRHGIGHHVGLETHDPEAEPLQPGNVIALETGYYDGETNIRLENIYVVTKKGCDLLDKFQNTLVPYNPVPTICSLREVSSEREGFDRTRG